MKIINNFKLTIESKSINESFSRAVVASFCTQLDPTLEEIADIKMAVSEAVTNCIVHAYPDYVGKIFIYAAIYNGNYIKIIVRDKGCGIVDVEQAMEPLFTTLGGERAGLGFAVMENFMDSVNVRSAVGKGTSITMIKKINGRADK